ncbi:proline-rich protein 5-like isoform X1 [Acipenser oxyrinchus oxyrinchus]|uniref:Proline-rich protein 5-like isoform X1 n=1 Tax=Acipenser oxyrinchus oxyrinchus TaxID=40147 RepID=A0AAD8DFI2_ACIOX|nr:proline-rich protein 5-like isoform X1 [Acipenser oxyrinchus oxyrinchus]
MTSTSLSDLSKSEKAALDERGTQHRRAGANATWNSIHNGVISVFQRKGLPESELYTLNEGVRRLLKTELGSFFSEYLQNQLLTKGMVILRDKIRFYEGQKLLDSLADTWDFFFSDVLPMLQAIFYPVQGKEPSVRQLALLHFRNIITLNIKLEDAISRPRARVPPSIIQMLLILQGVHESKGGTEDYLKLEALIQKVVSPYLGTHGLFSDDGQATHCTCVLEKRYLRRCAKAGEVIGKNPVVRSKSYNNPILTPVVEYECEVGSAGSTGIRRHSVSEMTSCLGLQGYSNLTTIMDAGSKTSMAKTSQSDEQDLSGGGGASPPSNPGLLCEQDPGGDQHAASLHPSHSSSAETTVDQTLESTDSDSEGIFIDFSHRCSNSPGYSRETSRRSVV